MTRNAQDIIDDMRRIAKMLLETNFEGCGKEDKAEFETEVEIILTLAEMALEQESILDKVRAEIEQEIIPRDSDQYDHEAMWQNCGLRMTLKVIDKYKAEIKPQESEEM